MSKDKLDRIREVVEDRQKTGFASANAHLLYLKLLFDDLESILNKPDEGGSECDCCVYPSGEIHCTHCPKHGFGKNKKTPSSRASKEECRHIPESSQMWHVLPHSSNCPKFKEECTCNCHKVTYPSCAWCEKCKPKHRPKGDTFSAETTYSLSSSLKEEKCDHKNTKHIVTGHSILCERCKKNLRKKPSQRIREHYERITQELLDKCVTPGGKERFSLAVDQDNRIQAVEAFLDEELG